MLLFHFVSKPFHVNAKQGMGAVGGGGGSGDGGGEDDEADPLDAFMTGLEAPTVTQARTRRREDAI